MIKSVFTNRRQILALIFSSLASFLGLSNSKVAAKTKVIKLEKWSCTNQDCDPYIYDPSIEDININDEDNPIPPGVAFEDLPDDWICHVCGDPKSHFEPLGEWVEVTIQVL